MTPDRTGRYDVVVLLNGYEMVALDGDVMKTASTIVCWRRCVQSKFARRQDRQIG
jgi:hypothetical protein